jgi:phosphopantothenoylcysteine decarboxylase/phosphopantothenate--cysteine ligase
MVEAPSGSRILLVIGGGIAAYKCLELIRRLKERGVEVRCVLTKGATNFVTPLSVAALSVEKVYTDLFSLTDEAEMGHIRLSREADLVVVAPATADLLAKMAHGLADDLASTVLLATDKPVLVAPAMNPMMWGNAATRRNVAQLRSDGVGFVGPDAGDMACGEVGSGRMAEPADILQAVLHRLAGRTRPLAGLRMLVTSGPTREPIDPVRFIMNHSSGKQGHAIAEELADAGASVTLVTGPVGLPDPPGVQVTRVETARDMLAACQACLPVDVAVCAAAVADWRPLRSPDQKIKKQEGFEPPVLELVENPDILAALSAPGERRPRLVIGFAAETENLVEHAIAKRARKKCDWILANDVSPGSGTFGGDNNQVTLVTEGSEPDHWPAGSKRDVARMLAQGIARAFRRG